MIMKYKKDILEYIAEQEIIVENGMSKILDLFKKHNCFLDKNYEEFILENINFYIEKKYTFQFYINSITHSNTIFNFLDLNVITEHFIVNHVEGKSNEYILNKIYEYFWDVSTCKKLIQYHKNLWTKSLIAKKDK